MIGNDRTSADNEQTLDLLAELERSTPGALRKERAHLRIEIRSKIIAQYADSSRRLDLKLQGVTGDISRGGCQALFPIPLGVGDIYLLTFDRSALDLSPIIARCMRCRYVREDAYETGLAFFSEIDLPDDPGSTSTPLV